MSEAKHTPGKIPAWRPGIPCDSIVTDAPAGGNDREGCATRYYGGHLVAESVPPQFRTLIAAAPDLLEAAETLLFELATGGTELQKEVIANARAAIAKATGEVQS